LVFQSIPTPSLYNLLWEILVFSRACVCLTWTTDSPSHATHHGGQSPPHAMKHSELALALLASGTLAIAGTIERASQQVSKAPSASAPTAPIFPFLLLASRGCPSSRDCLLLQSHWEDWAVALLHNPLYPYDEIPRPSPYTVLSLCRPQNTLSSAAMQPGSPLWSLWTLAVVEGGPGRLFTNTPTPSQLERRALSSSDPHYPSPWMNPDADGWQDAYAKAKAFVSQLTLLEKVNLTTGVGYVFFFLFFFCMFLTPWYSLLFCMVCVYVCVCVGRGGKGRGA
jgi:hypothetical protein